jgi:hypothetical protein
VEGISMAEGLLDGEKQAMPNFQVCPDICLMPEKSYRKL